MSKLLQMSLLAASIIVLFVVIYNVIKNKMNIRYALVWIVWGIGIVIIAICPEIIYSFSKMIGLVAPTNTVFLIMIFLLYCLTFYLYFAISKHNEDIVNLNYEIASLKKKLEEKEKK